MTYRMNIPTAMQLRDRLTVSIKDASRSNADEITFHVHGKDVYVKLTYEEPP